MPTLTRNKRNGHNTNPMDMPFDGNSLTDIERTVQAIDMPNVAREFVHAGKSYGDVLMRTVFADANQRNAVITYIYKCEKFHMDAHLEMMLNWLDAAPSVGGRARIELLQAATGIIATGLNPTARGVRPMPKERGEREQ